MVRAAWVKSVQLTLICIMFATMVLRPPGVMLSEDNGTITYVICVDGKTHPMTVSLEGEKETPAHISQDCEFFNSQIAALLNQISHVSLTSTGLAIRISQFQSDIFARLTARSPNSPRAPPFGTEFL